VPAPKPPIPARRADAERNREKVLVAARAAFSDPGADVAMAEISRRAGVGMATLYRNFPGRRELLEALYVGEVDAICEAADTIEAATPGARLTAWLLRFAAYFHDKHPIASELLEHTDAGDPVFEGNRARVLAAGRGLLVAAQDSGEVRADLTLEQVLDMVIAVAKIRGDEQYVAPILAAALDGLRPAPQPEPEPERA
jgi:AcrR family transcriptional regulator